MIIAVAGFGLWLLWPCITSKDDAAAGVQLGQVGHAEDAFQHAPESAPWPTLHHITDCRVCGRVTKGSGLFVRVGDTLDVRKTLCCECQTGGAK